MYVIFFQTNQWKFCLNLNHFELENVEKGKYIQNVYFYPRGDIP